MHQYKKTPVHVHPYNVLTVGVPPFLAGALVVQHHVLGVQEELALQKLGGGLDLVQVTSGLLQLPQQSLHCGQHRGQGQGQAWVRQRFFSSSFLRYTCGTTMKENEPNGISF